ncbi:ankyrin repeat domain-containing protein [Vibrio alfacsensis]|uniref:ankyrin repeat domain-containing protein n=2 Tax=Vibrio TaxID=662 RepID=UPI00078CAA46|nr:ankyrin repeat domain-containing protein [Vibrio alfacsensis]BAU71074.1 hypothetical protein [Vibrio sp. 04Ya108]BBM67664.1 hypothetical protein VA249_43100 [Vibrio alfacsensis]BCN27162.1 hypothetical protein VYA_43540 [Vibrio alfacsensis]
MELSKVSCLKSAVEALNEAQPIFDNQPYDESLCSLLGPVMTLGYQIQTYAPALLEKKEVTIIMAYSDPILCPNFGHFFELLNTILATNITFKIVIQSDIDLEVINFDVALNPDLFTNKKQTSVSLTDICLSDAVDAYQPDLLVLMHPDNEYYLCERFVEDESMKKCLLNGVPVVGASFGGDQYKIDQLGFKGVGVDLTPMPNPFASNNEVELSRGDMKDILDSGLLVWAGTLWSLSLNDEGVNNELVELFDIGSSGNLSVNTYMFQFGKCSSINVLLNQRYINSRGDDCLRIFGPITLNLTSYELFNELNDKILVEDVQIDLEYNIQTAIDLPYNNYLIRAQVIRDHHEEYWYSEPWFEEYGKDPQVDIDGALGDLFEMNVEDFILKVSDHQPKVVSNDEQRIIEAIKNNDLEPLELMCKTALQSFTDECHRNLAHIAALTNNCHLAQIARINEVDFNAFDDDGYTVWHSVSQYDSIDVCHFIHSNNLCHHCLNTPSKQGGFTPAHCAVLSNSLEVTTFLIEHAANFCIKDNNGQSAGELYDILHGE